MLRVSAGSPSPRAGPQLSPLYLRSSSALPQEGNTFLISFRRVVRAPLPPLPPGPGVPACPPRDSSAKHFPPGREREISKRRIESRRLRLRWQGALQSFPCPDTHREEIAFTGSPLKNGVPATPFSTRVFGVEGGIKDGGVEG